MLNRSDKSLARKGSTPTVGKSIFITGAGSGMGREGAKLFHAKGWRVGAVDRNDDGMCFAVPAAGFRSAMDSDVSLTDKAAYAEHWRFCAGNAGGGRTRRWINAGISDSGWFETCRRGRHACCRREL